MIHNKYRKTLSVLLLAFSIFASGCTNSEEKPPDTVEVKQPEQIDIKAGELIEQMIRYADENKGHINDSVELRQFQLVKTYYTNNQFQPVWSTRDEWNPIADSLYRFIYFSKHYGLFPTDYHVASLLNMRNGLVADTLHKKNAALWARADLMLTDAYLNIATHLKLGRLPKDSVTLRNDSIVKPDYFLGLLQEAIGDKNIVSHLNSTEPSHRGYRELKAVIPAFLDSAKLVPTTYISYPYRDTAAFKVQVIKRFSELGEPIAAGDTQQLRQAVIKYQKEKGIRATGEIGAQTAASLNTNDWERFKRIAITLDRYKMLADTMPEKYIWVNIPAFQMQLRDTDTVGIESRVVVGKPITRTPLLTGRITDMVTYPQWTIPTSIIAKEILPGIKKDPEYLAKKGYSLVDDKGEVIDPYTVDWTKYKKGIPYKVVQGSGDDNALGILKFNFSNKYSVYLHDTNQRYFFKNTMRALSHGCVRVQEWQKLAYFILSNDSINGPVNIQSFKSDSLRAWLQRKEKHVIPVRTRIPLYIRYFTCEAREGKLKIYDDIYGEDKILSERYFASKPIF
ncbi:MAG: L,D-transpeptidase family protein [Gemmatimonadaceae bacterium]|nr:L,D-transpeptidase family protein [Chitinophagaceae bacterium]